MQANWIIGKQNINGCKYLLLSIKIFPMYNSQNDNSQIALKGNLAVVQLIEEKRDIKRRGTFLVGLYYLKGIKTWENYFLILSLLSHFSRVRLCATPWRQPTRLPRPWDSPGKNTGVGCHFLLQCRKVKSESEVTQSCTTLSNPMDCSLPGSSIHGIFQARVLEWVAFALSWFSV